MVTVLACASIEFSTNSAIAFKGLLCESAMMRIAFQSSPIFSLPQAAVPEPREVFFATPRPTRPTAAAVSDCSSSPMLVIVSSLPPLPLPGDLHPTEPLQRAVHAPSAALRFPLLVGIERHRSC